MINKNIIFMGMPGSGKGTVANILKNEINVIHLSTGDIFRNEIKNQTPLGTKVQQIVQSGGYVPDEITNAIVKQAIDKLNASNQQFILDGYPRTIEQAKFLSNEYGNNFYVIKLNVSTDAVLERLSGRRTCPKCATGYHVSFKQPKVAEHCDLDGEKLIIRADDQPEKVLHRLQVYNEQTTPLFNYYNELGLLFEIDASVSPQEVANQVLNIIK
ncbi:adenylate kinase family protein [Mycoplasma corogypsi]|uniref:adenylate kinase family protein n=1 Tax=Mycoplasma corogypsi TaxID=2106 RepID=UPI003873B618